MRNAKKQNISNRYLANQKNNRNNTMEEIENIQIFLMCYFNHILPCTLNPWKRDHKGQFQFLQLTFFILKNIIYTQTDWEGNRCKGNSSWLQSSWFKELASPKQILVSLEIGDGWKVSTLSAADTSFISLTPVVSISGNFWLVS